MKRVNLFMMAAIVAASSVFVSCNKEDGVTPASISFANVQNDRIVLEKGVTKYTVTAMITSDENLKSVKVSRKVGSVTNQVGSTITSFPDKKSYTLVQEITDINEDCEVTVTVDNGTETARTLTIIYTAPDPKPTAGEINTWANITLGSLAHQTTAGSACASIEGDVFNVVNITATNQAKVDFIYFNGSSSPFALAAPFNSSVGTLSNVSGWNTRNQTKLTKLSGVTAAQFDACQDDKLITDNVTTAAVTTDIVTNLAQNDVIGFITATARGSKMGLIKVVSTSTDPQNLVINIKVQK